MSAGQSKIRRVSRSSKKVAPIADGEIDVLKFLVKSTLADERNSKGGFTTAVFGDVRVDFTRHEWYRKGKQLRANAREYELMKYFLQHDGEVVSKEQILREVWGFDEVPDTRSVDNYILALRKKIEENPARPRHLLTFRGAGYKFNRNVQS